MYALCCSTVNGELQKETYSYVDQLPVSEIIHQVRDLHQHQTQVRTLKTTWIGSCWYNTDFFLHSFFKKIEHQVTCLSFYMPLCRQPFIRVPVFFLFEVCPRLSLIWALSRKLCATSTNRCLCAVSMVTALSVKCKCLLVSVWRGHREIQQNG